MILGKIFCCYSSTLMMGRKILPGLFLCFFCCSLWGQQDSTLEGNSKADSVKNKKGWSFGAVPALGFDSDIGFKYGAVVNLFNYGKGDIYPNYLYSIYFEWSRTTKGSGINQIFFDSKYLLPRKIRITSDLSFLTEQTLNFYGFNGYPAYYNHALEDEQSNQYISRVFYRCDRRLLKFTTDLQGKLTDNNLRWLAGIALFDTRVSSVDIAKLNKGKAEKDKLPDVPGLYDRYVSWGIIPADQAKGGTSNFLKLGLIYDSRDNEPNPMKGIWSEAMLMVAPSFTGNKKFDYTQLALIHHQYFTLAEKKLSLACRIGWQTKLSGHIPFYMLPYMLSSYQTYDGLGGAKNMRGILRDRVVGDGFAYSNAELRYKFLRTMLFKQNFYIALSGFADAGMVTRKYKFDVAGVPQDQRYFFTDNAEKPHVSCGGGLHFALNENFIVAFDYGMATDRRDGNSGFYINLNFLY